MSDSPVASRPRTVLFASCLVAAPLAGVVEAVLSPLTGGLTSGDFAAIAAAPSRFIVAVLIGLAGTCLLVPALLGLAHRTSERSPRLSLVAAVAIVLSLLGFAGIRMAQAFELQFAIGSSGADSVAQFEAAVGNPIGGTMTLMFLVGNVVGVIVLAIALWRSRRVPIPAIVLLVLFPVLDTLVHGHLGPIVAHLVLLAALCWMAVAFLRTTPARRPRKPLEASLTI